MPDRENTAEGGIVAALMMFCTKCRWSKIEHVSPLLKDSEVKEIEERLGKFHSEEKPDCTGKPQPFSGPRSRPGGGL